MNVIKYNDETFPPSHEYNAKLSKTCYNSPRRRKMSYDVVIEQVKALPEQLLSSVSAFIVVFLWSNY